MRIAICLFGKIGGMSRDGLYADLDLSKLHENLSRYVMYGEHHFDVFIHSWSKNREEEIIDLYKPKNYIIEEEKFIPPETYRNDRAHHEDTWGEGKDDHDRRKDCIHRAHTNLWSIEIFNSRWYSQSRAVKLMDWYSKKTETKYDAVYLSRFDCAWRTHFNWKKAISSESISVLAGQFQDHCIVHGEVIDFWFASTQRNISELGKAWDWIQRSECFDFKQATTCKEHFTAMTSHKMAYHMIANVVKQEHTGTGMGIWADYVQHVDCDLARGSDEFWQMTDLGEMK